MQQIEGAQKRRGFLPRLCFAMEQRCWSTPNITNWDTTQLGRKYTSKLFLVTQVVSTTCTQRQKWQDSLTTAMQLMLFPQHSSAA
eukprot:4135852-Amphidinium_carterae.1